MEKELYEMLKILNYNIEIKKRYILEKREIDLFLTNYNIAIEFNGCYWHSIKHKE